MEIAKTKISALEEKVLAAKKIALLIHKNPDGDALGSVLALTQVLQQIGKAVVPVCADKVPTSFEFLPAVHKIQADFAEMEFDLIVVLDCGDPGQTGFQETKPKIWDQTLSLVKIDHHALGREFGELQIVYPDRAATSEILLEIFLALKIKITPPIATCLLTGLMTDTGSFRHSNTTPQNLRLAAQLLRLGANLPIIRRAIFQTKPLKTLKLWGQVLSNLSQSQAGVTLGVVRAKDFQQSETEVADLAGLNDLVNAVPEAQFSVLLSERGANVKGSLRTLREDQDVAKIASNFGGGGHIKAAGFTLPGKLQKEIRWQIVDARTQRTVDLNTELLTLPNKPTNSAPAAPQAED